MKSIVLAFVFLSAISFSQVKTTIQNGNFWSAFTWDCSCLPANGDSLVVDHTVSLSSGIAYTSGQIYISSSGVIDQGANNFSFYINGGSLINHGTLTIDNLLLDTLGFIENHGLADLDSVWTRSTTTNTGTINTSAFAHDQNATFTNSGNLDVMNNYNNQGWFYNNGIMTVGNDASNCNLQTLNAIFDNNGFFCVAGDFLNCANDTLSGSGTVYIGGSSTNDGEVNGSLHINTPTAGFTFNLGTIAGTVTFGTDGCAAGIEDEQQANSETDWVIFPNPATTVLNSSEQNLKYFVYDHSGKLVLSGATFNGVIHISQLIEGNYVIQLENVTGKRQTKTFIKL